MNRPSFEPICLHHRRPGHGHDCWCLDQAKCECFGGTQYACAAARFRSIEKAFQQCGKTFRTFAEVKGIWPDEPERIVEEVTITPELEETFGAILKKNPL